MFHFVQIDNKDDFALNECRKLIVNHSWGINYPISPLKELRTAEYIIGGYYYGKLFNLTGRIIGCSYLSKYASPDGIDNGYPWICGAVVVPELWNKGVFTTMYHLLLRYSEKTHTGNVMACTDNDRVKGFLERRGWKKVRETLDEGNAPCDVYALKQNRLPYSDSPFLGQ